MGYGGLGNEMSNRISGFLVGVVIGGWIILGLVMAGYLNHIQPMELVPACLPEPYFPTIDPDPECYCDGICTN